MNVMFPVMLGPTWLPMSYNPSVASSPSGHLNGWVSPETAASAAEAVAGPGETPARSRWSQPKDLSGHWSETNC